MAAMMLMLINFSNAHSHYKFISIDIIAAICWLPPLILQLFSPRHFKATPFFIAWLFCVDITCFCNYKFQSQAMVGLDTSF